MGSGNWIVDNLNSALGTWNDKLAEIWTLLSTGPEEFKGGGVWSVIVGINDGLKAIGYALLVIFFVIGVVKTCGSFTELRKPEQVNCTPFVRQYGILNNKWGDLICQKGMQTRNTHQSSRSWWWKQCKRKSWVIAKQQRDLESATSECRTGNESI